MKHTCPVCNLELSSKIALKRHCQAKHDNEKPYQCNECSYRAVQLSTFERHMMRHTGQHMFSCGNCEATFIQEHSLQCHRDKVHYKIKRYECMYCAQQFYSVNARNLHVRRKHEKSTHLQCPNCPYMTESKSRFMKHIDKTCVHQRELQVKSDGESTEDNERQNQWDKLGDIINDKHKSNVTEIIQTMTDNDMEYSRTSHNEKPDATQTAVNDAQNIDHDTDGRTQAKQDELLMQNYPESKRKVFENHVKKGRLYACKACYKEFLSKNTYKDHKKTHITIEDKRMKLKGSSESNILLNRTNDVSDKAALPTFNTKKESGLLGATRNSKEQDSDFTSPGKLNENNAVSHNVAMIAGDIDPMNIGRENDTFLCQMCSKSYRTEHRLQKHEKRRHNNRVICPNYALWERKFRSEIVK